jgi:hypothetical protein
MVERLVEAGVYKQWTEDGTRYVSHRVVTAGREEGTYGEKGTNKVVSFGIIK